MGLNLANLPFIFQVNIIYIIYSVVKNIRNYCHCLVHFCIMQNKHGDYKEISLNQKTMKKTDYISQCACVVLFF